MADVWKRLCIKCRKNCSDILNFNGANFGMPQVWFSCGIILLKSEGSYSDLTDAEKKAIDFSENHLCYAISPSDGIKDTKITSGYSVTILTV